MANNSQNNGLDIILYELQLDFNNALKIKDYRAMSEIITEAHRIKNDAVGGFLYDLSKKFYFTELLEENVVVIPLEVTKPLDICPDTKLIVYMNTKYKYIVVDPDACITLEKIKCTSDHIKKAVFSKINANGELHITAAMIKSLGAETGDIITITSTDDSFEIKKYSDNDFSWGLECV